VKNGLVVPNYPLPEGARVRIEVYGSPLDVPPELQEELEMWQAASARAMEVIERLEEEERRNEKG
jgi:hypothetical protein